MSLQPSIHVVNGKVEGAYAPQSKNVSYNNTNVEAFLNSIAPQNGKRNDISTACERNRSVKRNAKK